MATPAPPAPTATVTRQATQLAARNDANRLRFTMMSTMKIKGEKDPQTISSAEYAEDEVISALAYTGVDNWSEFLSLGPEDIQDLVVPTITPTVGTNAGNVVTGHDLSRQWKRKLRALLAFYHFESRKISRPIDLLQTLPAHFDKFRTEDYCFTEAIIPWGRPEPKTREATTALQNWQRTVKPSRADFKEFRDEATWSKSKAKILSTLEAQGLAHLVDTGYIPADVPLDVAQMKWFYSVLEGTMNHPYAKTLITQYVATKDTRLLWRDLCEHYDKSMSAKLRCQRYSSYITSARKHTASWRGSDTNYLLHWKEQMRQYAEIAPQDFTDNQKNDFLQACIAGTPHLSGILQQNTTAARAAGIIREFTFEEYFNMVLEHAAVKDSSNNLESNPRSRKSLNVNMMECVFEDGQVCYEPFEMEVNGHRTTDSEEWDMDTPITRLEVHQTDTANAPPFTQPQRIWMDDNTWGKMSTVPTGDLLHMATHPTGAHTGNIAMVLSQQTRANRNVRLHEIMERSDCSPYENSGDAPYEINAHQWNIGDDLEDEEPVYVPDDEEYLEDEEPVYVPDDEEEPDLPAIVAEEEGAILHCAFADDNATAEGVEDDYEGPSRAYYESCVRAHSEKKKKEAEDDKLYYEKEMAHYEGYTLEYQARAEYTENNNRSPIIPYYGRDEDGRVLSGSTSFNDGDSRYGDGASYGSYSSHEDDEGSDEDYDSDFL